MLHTGDTDGDHAYEERITLWQARSFDEAIERAEAEVTQYATDLTDTTASDLFQAYHLFDEPADGAEVFSLIRMSNLQPDEYVDTFFDTGAERQQAMTVEPGERN